jgi:hypothetical protein
MTGFVPRSMRRGPEPSVRRWSEQEGVAVVQHGLAGEGETAHGGMVVFKLDGLRLQIDVNAGQLDVNRMGFSLHSCVYVLYHMAQLPL